MVENDQEWTLDFPGLQNEKRNDIVGNFSGSVAWMRHGTRQMSGRKALNCIAKALGKRGRSLKLTLALEPLSFTCCSHVLFESL